MMSLVFAAIMPHGPDIIPEITDDLAMMAQTRGAMEHVAARFVAAKVDTLVLLDPDLVHRQNKSATRTLYTGEPIITVATAPQAGGTLGKARDSFRCDLEFAQAILKDTSFPTVSVPGENGEFPLVGGGLIPLWYTIHPLPEPRPKLVVITPSPGVARGELRRFGMFLAQLAQQSDKRIALVASADQGHTHDPKHPKFGFSPGAAEFDVFYCDVIRQNNFDALMEGGGINDQLLKDSWSDSLWVTLILAGLLDANPLPLRFFNYAVPTYFGMAVALYEE
ncbi:MAG: hypothetical protein FWD53_10870 [Phycisphaerales bacterium]|nr:hypothetical protein [Phycisphaerales bacterium]